MKFVRRVAFWATGGGHLKYYINWPEKCSTPQTPSNRSFLTPKTGHFGGGPENPHFLDFFADFLQNCQNQKFHDFCLTLDLFEHAYVAATCITLECYHRPLMTLDYAHFHPVTSTLSSHVIAYITFLLRLWHEKQRPTRLLLIFRSLAQVTLMHASSALQLTLGHAQPEGVLLPTSSSIKRFARGPRSHFMRFTIQIEQACHSIPISPSLTWEGLPEVIHKLSVGTDSFLMGSRSLLRTHPFFAIGYLITFAPWVDRRSPIAP